MTVARIGWRDLPAPVRAAVEDVVGGPVVSARSQAGGFSPGSADRVRTAAGRRAFVKAVSRERHERSARLALREARVTAALPAGVPAPRLLGCHDDGTWVALVFADVAGRAPARPWPVGDVTRALAALAATAAHATPAPEPQPWVAPRDAIGERLAGWHRIAAGPPPDLDPWTAARLDELCARADAGAAVALAGDSLVHTDLRGDNVLLTPAGAVLVDWPWAGRGSPALDVMTLLADVHHAGGHDPHTLLATAGDHTDLPARDLTAVLTALTGELTDKARLPPPPGVPPGVRAFQAAQARAALRWLRELARP